MPDESEPTLEAVVRAMRGSARGVHYLVVTAQGLAGTATLARLRELYPIHCPVTDTAWLVWSVDPNETTRTVSERIFSWTLEDVATTRPPAMVHAVFLISSWWGYHDRTLWEWLDRTKSRGNG